MGIITIIMTTTIIKNSSGGKNWPLHLIDLHEMTLWNFAIGGAVIDTKM